MTRPATQHAAALFAVDAEVQAVKYRAPHSAHMTRPPLVLTGGPAVGKTTTAHGIAKARPRCAVVDVDDVRQRIVAVAAAPWQGSEGERQQRLGVTNTCALAKDFLVAGVEVVIADVLSPETAELYGRELPGCLIVHLIVARAEALRRAVTRTVWLTDAEFAALYDADESHPPDADIRLDVDDLDVVGQVAAVEAHWALA
jgi:predicted kinase